MAGLAALGRLGAPSLLLALLVPIASPASPPAAASASFPLLALLARLLRWMLRVRLLGLARFRLGGPALAVMRGLLAALGLLLAALLPVLVAAGIRLALAGTLLALRFMPVPAAVAAPVLSGPLALSALRRALLLAAPVAPVFALVPAAALAAVRRGGRNRRIDRLGRLRFRLALEKTEDLADDRRLPVRRARRFGRPLRVLRLARHGYRRRLLRCNAPHGRHRS